MTLLLSVWDWDRFGGNQFLGEVRLPLNSLNLIDTSNHWHTLQDKVRSTITIILYTGVRLRGNCMPQPPYVHLVIAFCQCLILECHFVCSYIHDIVPHA